MSPVSKANSVHGWLILDKPQGLTSTQALGKARRLLGGGKAGHGGTLDPMATGLLPLAFGEATKLIPYAMDGTKHYEFTIRWGIATDTEDAEGQITATSPHRPSHEAILAALPPFTGMIMQKPPVFSALKIGGRRSYDLARKGDVVEPAPRPIQVIDLQLISVVDIDHACLAVTCGKGTYVRALARDLALALGTVGHIVALRRTRTGAFGPDHMISLENLAEMAHKGGALSALQPVASALDDIPAHAISAQDAQSLRQGRAISALPCEDKPAKPTALAVHDGKPVALIALQDGFWRPVRGFNL